MVVSPCEKNDSFANLLFLCHFIKKYTVPNATNY